MVAGYIEALANQFGRKNTFFLNIARNNRYFYKKNVEAVCTSPPLNNVFKVSPCLKTFLLYDALAFQPKGKELVVDGIYVLVLRDKVLFKQTFYRRKHRACRNEAVFPDECAA